MKSKIFKFLLILFSLVAVVPGRAQVVVDTTGDLTVYLLGVTFKVHKLQEGENILALSRVYNVPLEQIFAYNNLPENITPGTEIRIPRGNFPERSVIDTVVCCLHKVQRHESINAIAQKYGSTPELIVKFNPQIKKRGLKRNKYIRIPIVKLPDDYQDQYFIYHPYKRGETPQILAIYYSIPVSDIEQFNGKDAYQLGKFIVIPKEHYKPDQVSILRADYISLPDFTGINQIYGQAPPNPPCETYRHTPETQYNIALILPFFINENYVMLEDLKVRKTADLYDKTRYFYQFLFGSLIALDELKQLGININLHIYDSRNSSTRLKNILDRDEFAKMDLVIGPAYSSHYDIVRDYAQYYDISFVAPLTRKQSVIDSNPNVFLANPSDMKLMKRTARFLAPSADTANIVVLHHGGYSQKLADEFEKELKRFAIENYGWDTINVTVTYFDPTDPESYTYLFNKEKSNYVVIPVNNEVFVNGVLNYLNGLQSLGYPLTVFGMPSWEQFRNFDLQWFLNLKIHYPSAYYLDRSDPKVLQFEDKYLRLYHALPTYYSYLGYDIMNYFAHALKQYGKTFRYCLTPYSIEPSNKGIYMNFEFEKDTVYNGFENNAVFMLYYDENLKLRKIDSIK